MFKWADPTWLQFLWAALALFIFAILSYKQGIYKLTKYFGEKRQKFLTGSVSPFKRKLHLSLQVLCMICFALSLARPLLGSRRSEVKQTGLEMIIALDVSTSMLAEDDKPSRLEHAKHEIMHLLDLLSGDRVGVIAFAGSAVLVSPMTSDHSAVKMYVASLNTNSVSTQGTNFKDVADEAIRAFERGGVEGLNGTKPTRVLLIASDGEDNEPGGISAMKKATDQGVRVFALGFGSARGAPIPIRDERGNLTSYKKDRSNQPVLSMPSDEGLSKLTRAGGGSYFHSTFDEGEIKNLIADFDKLGKADFKSQMSTDYDEKFQIPLMLGILFGFLELLIGDRKTSRSPWRGRFEMGAE